MTNAKVPFRFRPVLRILLLLGIMILAAAWWDWDLPAIDRWIRQLASRRDVQLEGQRFSYSPIRGLLLHNARVRAPLPNGEAILEIPRGSLRFDLLRISSGNWCRKIHTKDVEINLLLGSAKEGTKPPDSPDRDYLDLEPKYPRFEPRLVNFENSTLVLREPGKEQAILVLEALTANLEDLRLSPFVENPFKALISSGEIRSPRLLFGTTEYSGVSGRFRLIDGRFTFEDLQLNAPAGAFHLGPADLNLASYPPLLKAELLADLSDARLLGPNLFLGFSEPIRGKLRCGLSGKLMTSVGDCRLVLEVDGMDVGGVPFIHKIARLVLETRQPVVAKDRWVLPIKVRGSTYELQNIQLATNRLSFHLDGQVSEHYLALVADVLIPKAEIGKDTFSPSVITDLSVGPDLIRLPFRVTGTLTKPETSIRKDDLSPLAFSEVEAFLRFRAAVEKVFGDFLH